MLGFRRIEIAELKELQEIALKTFVATYQHNNDPQNFQLYLDENFSLEQLTEELNNPLSDFYFLEFSDAIVGYIKLNRGAAQTDVVAANTLEIERIYVIKEQQGKGFGKLLIDKSIKIANADQLDFIWLGVWEKNPEAIAFYEHLGFQAFGTHSFTVGHEDQTDILMKLVL